jgi:hypothetical protein
MSCKETFRKEEEEIDLKRTRTAKDKQKESLRGREQAAQKDQRWVFLPTVEDAH